jgi:hypothetical protein
MASGIYPNGVTKMLSQDIDFLNDTIKVALVTDAYTFDPDETAMTAVASAEPSVSGYAGGFSGAGRKTLASKTLTTDTTNNRTKIDAADPSAWTLASGATLKGAVVYWHDTNDAGSAPIVYIEFGSTVPTNGGTFTLPFDADGIAYLPSA